MKHLFKNSVSNTLIWLIGIILLLVGSVACSKEPVSKPQQPVAQVEKNIDTQVDIETTTPSNNQQEPQKSQQIQDTKPELAQKKPVETKPIEPKSTKVATTPTVPQTQQTGSKDNVQLSKLTQPDKFPKKFLTIYTDSTTGFLMVNGVNKNYYSVRLKGNVNLPIGKFTVVGLVPTQPVTMKVNINGVMEDTIISGPASPLGAYILKLSSGAPSIQTEPHTGYESYVENGTIVLAKIDTSQIPIGTPVWIGPYKDVNSDWGKYLN